MGAGEFDAGEGLAGEDPVPAFAQPRNVTPPVALLLDGRTLDFPLDTTGLYRSVHPVDQEVALALMAKFGTIAGAPDTGNKLRLIRKLGPRTKAEATNIVNEAIGALIAANDIKLLDLTIETRTPQGALLVAVSYQNLRLKPSQPRTVRISPNAP